MELSKSSRFARVSGDFGEALFLYWLSKHGCETAVIDHTGIDLLAFHKPSGKRFGISVKSRTWEISRQSVYLQSDEPEKIREACRYFAAEPYVGVVVAINSQNIIDCLLIHLDDLLTACPLGKSVVSIDMSGAHWEKYEPLKRGMRIHFDYAVHGEIGRLPGLADES